MKISPSYNPIVQMPHCCVPACLTMILDRRGIAHGTQEEIGNELGLIISPINVHLFKHAVANGDYEDKYGTQIDDKKYSINNFFIQNNIPLQEVYFSAENISEPRRIIADNISAGNDLIACINNEVLFGKGSGHATLIQEINEDTVTLIDPGIDKPKIRTVQLDKLIEAAKANKRRGGFWVISAKKG